MMKKTTLGLAALLSVISMQAYAAEEAADKTYYFDEVVVTASGKPETLFTSKSNTQVITAEQIENMHYKSVEEAIRNVSGVQIYEYNTPGHDAANVLRINGAKQVVVLVDGVRLSTLGAETSFIRQLMNDMDSVERIEVVKGAASVLYGSDAKGGVINIITKKVDKFQSTLGVEGGSFKHETYKIATQGKAGKTSYRVFAEKYHDGDFRDGQDNNVKNRRNGHDESVMLAHEFSEGNKIQIDYRHADEDWAYEDLVTWGSEYSIGLTKTDSFDVILDNKINDKLSNKFSYVYAKYKTGTTYNKSSYYVPWGYAFRSNDFKDMFVYSNRDNTLTLGLESIKSETFAASEFSNTKGGDYLKNNSIFVTDEFKFGRGWNLTAGIRFDDAESSGNDIDSNWSKSVNLGYKFNEKSNIYIAYNDYFVLPTMGQLYNTSYGNRKLDPAKGKNYEIGFNHKITPEDVVSVHYFYRKSDNVIDFYGDGSYSEGHPNGYYYNKTDESKARGFDIQYDKTFDGHWHGKISWAHLTSDEESYGFLPSNQFTLGVDYMADKWNFGLDVRAYIGRNGSSVDYSCWPQGGKYFLADIGVSYKATKNIKVYAKVNNIFDKYYAESSNAAGPYGVPGEYYAMPGRTFIVGMNWSF